MIFYFSGTGNTQWVAQQLAEATGEQLISIAEEMRKSPQQYVLTEGERFGFCFPTHGWQPPRLVRQFIQRSSFRGVDYVFAVTTCGDNMGEAMTLLNKELRVKGLETQSMFAVLMPESNVCFPFLHLDTKEREREKIAAAQERVKHIIEVVNSRRKGVVELIRGAIPYTYTYVIGGYYNKHLITDKKFWVDEEACIRCGLCAKLCPVDDIVCLEHADGQHKTLPPRWKHDGSCTNCLACYHHCPRHAIHWGKMKRGQYVFKVES